VVSRSRRESFSLAEGVFFLGIATVDQSRIELTRKESEAADVGKAKDLYRVGKKIRLVLQGEKG